MSQRHRLECFVRPLHWRFVVIEECGVERRVWEGDQRGCERCDWDRDCDMWSKVDWVIFVVV